MARARRAARPDAVYAQLLRQPAPLLDLEGSLVYLRHRGPQPFLFCLPPPRWILIVFSALNASERNKKEIWTVGRASYCYQCTWPDTKARPSRIPERLLLRHQMGRIRSRRYLEYLSTTRKLTTRKLTEQYERTVSLPRDKPIFTAHGIHLFADAKKAAARTAWPRAACSQNR